MGNLILFIAPVYYYHPILVRSLQLQTHTNWKLLLIHDGPNLQNLKQKMEHINDNRITYIETTTRRGYWGHYVRQHGLNLAKDIVCDYIVMTNADNYYVPNFIEKMFEKIGENIAVYCDIIHNYKNWALFPTRLEKYHMDCGCFMAKKEVVLSVGWKKVTWDSDWYYVNDIITKYGRDKILKVSLPLFVHN